MALYSGKTGYIKRGNAIDGDVIGHMSSFNLEMSTDIIEVVAFGNTYKEKIPSIMDWSASAEGNVDFEDGHGQTDLVEAYQSGALMTIGLGITDDIYFEGTCYIESISIDNASDDSPTISISFAGSNAISFQYSGDKKANKTALSALINQCSKLKEDDYTPVTWSPFKAKYDAAVIVEANGLATQDEVDVALAELIEAKNELITKE